MLQLIPLNYDMIWIGMYKYELAKLHKAHVSKTKQNGSHILPIN